MAGFFTCRGKFRTALGRVMNSAYGSEVIVEQEIGKGRGVLVALISAVMADQANRFICSSTSSIPIAFRITIHATFFTA
jgi:hypothetical protein